MPPGKCRRVWVSQRHRNQPPMILACCLAALCKKSRSFPGSHCGELGVVAGSGLSPGFPFLGILGQGI